MEIQLKNVRMAFPALFEARAIAGADKSKYSAALLFAEGSDAFKVVSKAQAEVAKGKWGDKTAAVLKSLNTTPDKLCLKNGDAKSEYDGYEGNYFVNSSSDVRPTVIDRDRSPLTAADGKPYGGCFVNAIVDIWAQDNQYGKRINATLKGIQFVKDGDSFGAATAPASADAFDDLGEGADADDLE